MNIDHPFQAFEIPLDFSHVDTRRGGLDEDPECLGDEPNGPRQDPKSNRSADDRVDVAPSGCFEHYRRDDDSDKANRIRRTSR